MAPESHGQRVFSQRSARWEGLRRPRAHTAGRPTGPGHGNTWSGAQGSGVVVFVAGVAEVVVLEALFFI